MFHINFIHNMHNLWNHGKWAHWKLNDLDLTYQDYPRSNIMRSTERQCRTSYMCFIQTLIKWFTVYEMQPLWPWIHLWWSSKVKGPEVNWKIIYDFLYVFHGNFGHIMDCFWDIRPIRSQRSKCDLSGLAKRTFREIQ